jgi:hypothetical protein
VIALAIPAVEAAGEGIAAWWGSTGAAAVAGGAALGATASLSGDSVNSRSQSTPVVRAVPKTNEKCKQCPPESGQMLAANHSMNRAPREYQARITGFPYDVVDNVWSMEWWWENIWFDGFQAGQCTLQEAKGDFSRMFDEYGETKKWFVSSLSGFRETIVRQAVPVRANPPAKLTWYFQTAAMCDALVDTLEQNGVSYVIEP